VDLPPRKLRYFIAVAEELNFSRAARRLYIAQQSLSAQIRELEDEMGVTLFHRTTRKVELTAAGTVMLAAARTALATLDDAVDEARRAERGELGTLKVGFIITAALELTRPILAAFRDRFPAVKVELREFDFSDTSAGLAGGWADVAVVRPPISAEGIEFETLFVEPRVIAVVRDHPLADRDAVSVEEVLELPLAIGITPDAAWRGFWTLADQRGGGEPPRAVRTHSQTEENEIVAAGEACSITAAGVARYMPHAGIRYIPISGIDGSAAALAWHADRHTALVDRFIAVARQARDRETAIVTQIEHPFDQTPAPRD
jgi:DNA-binding transcriptional LysR family regulator